MEYLIKEWEKEMVKNKLGFSLWRSFLTFKNMYCNRNFKIFMISLFIKFIIWCWTYNLSMCMCFQQNILRNTINNWIYCVKCEVLQWKLPIFDQFAFPSKWPQVNIVQYSWNFTEILLTSWCRSEKKVGRIWALFPY